MLNINQILADLRSGNRRTMLEAINALLEDIRPKNHQRVSDYLKELAESSTTTEFDRNQITLACQHFLTLTCLLVNGKMSQYAFSTLVGDYVQQMKATLEERTGRLEAEKKEDRIDRELSALGSALALINSELSQLEFSNESLTKENNALKKMIRIVCQNQAHHEEESARFKDANAILKQRLQAKSDQLTRCQMEQESWANQASIKIDQLHRTVEDKTKLLQRDWNNNIELVRAWPWPSMYRP